MSNVLLFRISQTLKTGKSLPNIYNTSIRHASGKKFIVPDSFLPHKRTNNNRRNPRPSAGSGPQSSAPRPSWKDNVETSEGQVQQQVLENAIERRVQQEARNAFVLSNESTINGFCGQNHHPHIASSMVADVNVNYLNENAIELFWSALSDHIPQDPLTRSFVKSPRGKLSHSSYSWGNYNAGETRPDRQFSSNLMNLGWHLFLYSTPIPGHSLLYDGTDARFIPGPSSIWRYRLWAGGSINLHSIFAKDLRRDRAQHLLERPIDLRIVGANQTPEKLFVTVSKRFYELDGKFRPQEYDVPGVMYQLGRDPIHDQYGALVAGPYLEEKYTLCFLRSPPDLSGKGPTTKVITPPIQPKFSHTLVPDRHLLFCWSALSYNAHLIHLDKSFAQEEYGAKNLVVHGPLTLSLVLEWFHREITKYALERQLSRFHLISIDYRCLAPLFVDEAMTLCTKPSKFPTPGTLADSWDVWVQKDAGDGRQTVAFKGTVKLKIEQEPKFRQANRGRLRQISDDDTAAGHSGARQIEESNSPFS